MRRLDAGSFEPDDVLTVVYGSPGRESGERVYRAVDKTRIWTNEDRENNRPATVLATLWENGELHVATRPDIPGAVWGPPVVLTEEK